MGNLKRFILLAITISIINSGLVIAAENNINVEPVHENLSISDKVIRDIKNPVLSDLRTVNIASSRVVDRNTEQTSRKEIVNPVGVALHLSTNAVKGAVKKIGNVNLEDGCDPVTETKDAVSNIASVNDKKTAATQQTVGGLKLVKNAGTKISSGIRVKPSGSQTDEDDSDFFGADDLIVFNEGQRVNPKFPLNKIQPSANSHQYSNEDSEEDVDISVDHKDEQIPSQHPEKAEDVKELIQKLRKAGVSWRVINRELFGIHNNYLVEDYPVFRPDDFQRYHYLYHRRHRPYYGRYPDYIPYPEEDYYGSIFPTRHVGKVVPPVYFDDEFEKKKK